MTRCASLLSGLLLALLLGPAGARSAEAAQSTIGMTVVDDPTLPGGIAVYQQVGAQPGDYWCSAGDYANRYIRPPAGSVLVLARPRGAPGVPSRRASVGFTLAQGDGGEAGGVSVREVGERHSLASALALCLSAEQRRQRDDRR